MSRSRLLRTASAAGLSLALGGRWVNRALADASASPGAVSAVRHFYSRPDLAPPTITVERHAGALAPGSLFLAPSSGAGQRGTLIVDDRGEPLWFKPSTPVTAMNFRVASFRGKPVLTWWEGLTEQGLGTGTHVIVDDSYREIGRVAAAEGLSSDLHEFILTPAGTLLMTAWETVERDLSSVGHARTGKVVGGVVQELEYPSGRLLFEWHSLDQVALEESHAGVGDPFDYFHINSIAPTDDGNLLVSARNTWAIYKIDRGSGEIMWRLGGKRSDFSMGPDTFFAWQHDARPHGSLISLFDDGAAPKVQPQSRGLLLALDDVRMRATVHRSWPHTPPLLARALGSTQLLSNGNTLIGYGTAPYFTEYDANGRALLDAHLPPQGENYRALRFPWVGRPLDVPTLVSSGSGGVSRLYVSWNGATEVAAWQLRAGHGEQRLSDASRMKRAGFETALEPPAGATHAAVVALDAAGKPLATSATIRI